MPDSAQSPTHPPGDVPSPHLGGRGEPCLGWEKGAKQGSAQKSQGQPRVDTHPLAGQPRRDEKACAGRGHSVLPVASPYWEVTRCPVRDAVLAKPWRRGSGLSPGQPWEKSPRLRDGEAAPSAAHCHPYQPGQRLALVHAFHLHCPGRLCTCPTPVGPDEPLAGSPQGRAPPGSICPPILRGMGKR